MDDTLQSGLTLKAGKGYEAMWLTPKGTPQHVKEWLAEVFGFPAEIIAGKTPFEVMVMAEDVLQGRANLATMLGGTVITDEKAAGATESDAQTSGGDPWARLDGEAGGVQDEKPQEDPHAGLRSQIASAESRDALKRLWAANQEAFKDSSLMDEYKAKGKSLD